MTAAGRARNFADFGLWVLVFGMLAWLNGRAESEHLRGILAGMILVVAGAQVWVHRSSLWRPPAIVALGGVALVVLYLTSPTVNVAVFEQFTALAVGASIVWLLVWLLLRVVFPRTNARYQALPILMLSCALSFALLVCCIVAWLKAVDVNAAPASPVATSGAEIAALWRQPWGTRYNGIFAVGHLGKAAELDPRQGSDYLAYYNGPRPIGPSSDFAFWLPLSYEMRMADGAVVQVQGVASAAATSNWPECGPYAYQRCLLQGDPVVIWADPGELRTLGSNETASALTATRLIAYGSLADFRDGYLARAVATARVFGWIAVGFIPLSLIPAIAGFRRARWLRRNGLDHVPAGGGISFR